MSEAATIVKEEQPKPEEIALQWWRELQDRRGDRAELRRARSLEAVIFTAGYQRLWQRLRGTGWSREDGIALVAAVLAHAEANDASATFAAQLAEPGHSEKPRFSGLRFRRLLQNESWEELFEPAIRALALINGRANLANLANGLYWWSHKTRRQWAFEYYGANPGAE